MVCFFYKQKFGLSKGSPPSGVLAYLFVEFLEFGSFKFIIHQDSRYFRYIEDILLVYPQNNYLRKIMDRLNNIELTINFTYEQ